ncbi:MAG: class I SAM-dependent methyltransferase, partial [Rhodospirillales bacterium]|nr:class I SAM-dependent methyltransferase [Rhodospirillales bacterium]
ATLNGFAPLDLESEFTYCELGCGNGVSTAALAQLFPKGQFIGADFSAEHVENGTQLAEDAGLGNVSFAEVDFNDLADHDLPDFDFITLHGVYAWIDPETREGLRQFFDHKLKPGGFLYVSYNAMPGWSAIGPLREMVLAATLEMDADPITKMQSGLDYLNYMKEREAGYFADNPPAAAFVEEISTLDPHYLVHEFFVDFVKPYYFYQVAGEMRSIGLHFVGNAEISLNFLDLAAPTDFHKRLSEASTRIAFEGEGDFIRNQRFRRDLYCKGKESLDEEAQRAVLCQTPFGTSHAWEIFSLEARFGEVEINYQSPVFEALIDSLSRSAKSVEALKDGPGFEDYTPDLLIDGIKFLSAGNQLMPFARPTRETSGKDLEAQCFALPTGFNLAMLKRRLFKSDNLALAAPAAGIGLEVGMADALYALCLVEAPSGQVAEWAFQRSIEAGQQIVSDDGDEQGALEDAVDVFRETRLAKFIELGILEPAE